MIEMNKIYHGDNLEVLKTFLDNSIDAVVTDPPYGINFMNKSWDGKDIVANAKKRKDSGPTVERLNSGRSTVGIGESAYAGEYNTSLKGNFAFQKFTEEWARECFRVMKPGAHLISFASTRTYHRMVVGIEDAGFEIRDQLAWIFGSGFPKSHNLCDKWKGWGTALKPAYEPIKSARKPLEKGLSVKQNVVKWGTGALNIDASRIDFESKSDADAATWGRGTDITNGNLIGATKERGKNIEANPLGRWPANLMHDGSREVLNEFPDSEGQNGATTGEEIKNNHIYGKYNKVMPSTPRDDSGSSARFFYCAKTSSTERNLGAESLSNKTTNDGRSFPADMDYQRGKTERKNTHPTVKPIALMIWLIKLVTPPDGIICDLFSGSGTTKCASEILGINCIAIEREKDYIEISKARSKYWTAKRWNDYQNGLKPIAKVEIPNQTKLF